MHHGVDIVSALHFGEKIVFIWACIFQGKRLEPIYESAATTLAANDPPVALAKVYENIMIGERHGHVVLIGRLHG